MKTLVTIFLIVSSFICNAQSFFVGPIESGNDKIIKEKLKFEGYELTPYKEKADYILIFHLDKTKPTFSTYPAPTYTGYIIVADNTGKEVGRTKSVRKGAKMYNGYSAEWSVLKEITKKYMIPELQKIKPK